MSRVTMQHQISGTRNGQDWPPPGETIDLPDDEAAILIATGAACATETDSPAPVESAAVAEDTETATTKTGPSRRSR